MFKILKTYSLKTMNEIKRTARCDVASFEKSPTWWRTTAPQQMYQLARSCVLQNKEVYEALMKTKTAMLLFEHVFRSGVTVRREQRRVKAALGGSTHVHALDHAPM